MEQLTSTVGDDRFRRAMAESAIGMCLVDREGTFIAVNAALSRFFGLDAATLKQKTWQELTHPEDVEVDLALVQQVLRGERDHYRLAKRYLHASGSTLYADLVVSGIRDQEGRFKFFVSQIVDQTERTHAEERYRLLAENASDVVFRVENDGRFSWISPAIGDLLGYRVDEVVGRAIQEFIHPDDHPGLELARARVGAGQRVVFELRARRADGSFRWVVATVRPVFDSAGKVLGRIGNWRDIEAERQAREALAPPSAGSPRWPRGFRSGCRSSASARMARSPSIT